MGILAISLVLVVLFRVSGMAGKGNPTGSNTHLKRVQLQLNVEVQEEMHTCGFHALSSIYRGFGLDPDKLELRERLRVDSGAIPGVESTRGVLHTDLLRVVSDDGFEYEILDMKHLANAATELYLALHRGDVAVVLTWLDEDELYHWVAVDYEDGGEIRIVDSLEGDEVMFSTFEFVESSPLSIVLLRPRAVDTKPPGGLEISADGMVEMLRAHGRQREGG